MGDNKEKKKIIRPYHRPDFVEGSQQLADAKRAAAVLISKGEKTSKDKDELSAIWDKIFYAEGLKKIYKYHIPGSTTHITKDDFINGLVGGVLLFLIPPTGTKWNQRRRPL